ncbi:hypothetical protein T07_4936 [Trichinella nelsoni]|uniref:Uncharacterized protein n=1 Tax=Trichinella nelsoni TaxID=6336 RepID=A0A0V0SET4_9BILA|nr:hypothetical protein T07_4936 [Trichinella nelsoni]
MKFNLTVAQNMKSQHIEAFWVARSFLLVNEAFTDFSDLDIMSVIFRTVKVVCNSVENQLLLGTTFLLGIVHTTYRCASTFDILQYRQCTNKLRLCFQVKTDYAACTVINEIGWSTLAKS